MTGLFYILRLTAIFSQNLKQKLVAITQNDAYQYSARALSNKLEK